MPQLEMFIFGDQFLIIILLYVVFFFSLIFMEYFSIYKLFVYNFLNDGLSGDNCGVVKYILNKN